MSKNEHDQHQQDASAHSLTLIDQGQPQVTCPERQENNNHADKAGTRSFQKSYLLTQWLLVAITTVYSIVSIAQWRQTRESNKETSGANQQTKTMLQLTERPSVSLENANYAVPRPSTLFIVAGFRNTGRGPAVDVHVKADAYVGKNSVILSHGVTQPYWIPQQMLGTNQPLTLKLYFLFPENVDSLIKEGGSPNVTINLSYTDQFGNSFRLPTCFYFDRGSHDPSQCGMKE